MTTIIYAHKIYDWSEGEEFHLDLDFCANDDFLSGNTKRLTLVLLLACFLFVSLLFLL